MDPSTLVSVIGGVASIIQGVGQQAWENDVSSQLDNIVSRLDEVLQELRNLRIWFSQTLDEEVRRIWSANIDADKQTLDGIVAGLRGNPPDAVTINDRLYPLLNDVQTKTEELADAQRFGVSHFVEVSTGFATTICIMKLLNRPSQELRAFCQTILRFFELAIDPHWPNSFQTAEQAASDDSGGWSEAPTLC